MISKIKQTLMAQLSQGITPQKLALTSSFAVVFATFPIIGSTTLLCLFFGIFFKLNQPLIQALNWALAPVQLLMIPVLLRLGEWILNSPPTSISPVEMMALFNQDWVLFIENYGMAGVRAILAWLLLAPIYGVLVYYVVYPIFRKLKIKSDRERMSENP